MKTKTKPIISEGKVREIQKELHLRDKELGWSNSIEVDEKYKIENELNCLSYYDYPVCYKESLPKSPKDLDNIYFDQAPYNLNYSGFQFGSVYLEHGLKKMESFYIREIMKFPDKQTRYSKEEIEDLIKRNPHLHNIIKTNLIHNLNRR